MKISPKTLRVGIIANTRKYNVLNFLIDFLVSNQNKNRKFILGKATFDFLKESLKKNHLIKFVHKSDENRFKNKIDLLLSLGGDGTMLYSAQYAISADALLVGVNFGKLGFLADVPCTELNSVLDEIENGEYEVEEKLLLEGKVIGKNIQKFIALNDIVIEKGSWSRIIEINTWVNKNFLTTYRSDGLIISTPTGSTGYSLSAGGPIVLPETDVIVLSPICPHTLTVRPIVIPAETEIEIEAHSGYETITINHDGQNVYKFPPPVRMKIIRSPKKLKHLKRKNKDFFLTLREKLMWGMDIREKHNYQKENL